MSEKIKTNSIKVNFILNTFRLIISLLIPIFVFPYVSRILGPVNIGKIEFANSIISYFVLFAGMGIPMYGIREVARVRDNKQLLSKLVMELTFIELILVIICYFIYAILLLFVPRFNSSYLLYLIVAPNIFLGTFNYEWFYQGIENQTYITIRFVIVKLIQVLCIFFLIKNINHYLRYAALIVGLNCLSSVFNILYLKNFINIVAFKCLNLKKHWKPLFIVFLSSVATSIYAQLDTTMVGIFVDDRAVGIYSTANKLVRVMTVVVTSLGAVMMPRLSNNLANGEFDLYKDNLKKSLYFVLFLAIPFTFGLMIFAKPLINLLAGNEFNDSSVCMQILSPIIFMIGIAQFVGHQILYTNKQEKKYTIAVSCAAGINFICNLIMIPKFKQNGAAVGTLIAETSVTLLLCIFGRKYIKKANILEKKLILLILSGISIIPITYLSKHFISGNLLIQVAVVICWYLFLIMMFSHFIKLRFFIK